MSVAKENFKNCVLFLNVVVFAISEVTMEALMRLNASRAGHDKLVRSAQYASRFAFVLS